MKKIDLRQATQLLANVGVIAGIILLAYEIRQNTAAVRSDASQGIQNQLAAISTMATSDPMTEIYIEGMTEPARLEPLERAKFNAYLSNIISAYENLFAQVREGSYAESRATGYWQLMRNLMEYPGMRQHWDERSYIFSEDFRYFVENEVMALEPLGGSAILQADE